MFHNPPHSLGVNIVPPYVDPQSIIEYNPDGKIASINYEYPAEKD